MAELALFLGTWTSDDGPPFSRHTLTCVHRSGGRLSGRWLIEASAASGVTPGLPRQGEIPIGDAWLENDVLLFHINGGPFVTEFRLVGDNGAIVGAARHKLPPLFAGWYSHSIEGHRVRFTRQLGV